MARAISIIRRNPRTGRVERPWRNREGFFVLGDPAHGAQKHHDRFAVKVETLEEVASHVRRGFSVRMSDGESPPSLIAPDSLIVEEAEAGGPMSWMETLRRPPFDKEDMSSELKRAMLVQANQIAHAGRREYAALFMGFETENTFYPYCGDDPDQVDLSRFYATDYLDRAYDYAFQVGLHWRFDDTTAQNLDEFVRGANPQSSDGEASPLTDPNGFCRQAADMAFARWKLGEGADLSVRELALLAGMTEAAARNSLSKDEIRTQGGVVPNETAVVWLKARRGFVPTRIGEARRQSRASWSRFLLDRSGFAEAFGQLLRDAELSSAELSAKAQVPKEFVAALAAGRPQPDLAALRRVGEALDLDVPHFAGVAVQAALRAEEGH